MLIQYHLTITERTQQFLQFLDLREIHISCMQVADVEVSVPLSDELLLLIYHGESQASW